MRAKLFSLVMAAAVLAFALALLAPDANSQTAAKKKQTPNQPKAGTTDRPKTPPKAATPKTGDPTGKTPQTGGGFGGGNPMQQPGTTSKTPKKSAPKTPGLQPGNGAGGFGGGSGGGGIGGASPMPQPGVAPKTPGQQPGAGGGRL